MSNSDDSPNNPRTSGASTGRAPAEQSSVEGSGEEDLEAADAAGDQGEGETDAEESNPSGNVDGSRIRPEADPAAELEQRPTGEERVGEVLSRRYRLTEFLGRGAMGEVFRAEHALMKKTVAIKILHSDVSGHAKIVERFRREAQAAANIDHPNVCVATDFGQTAEKDFFLVMEFLEGATLKETVREQGAFEVERALYIANQIVSALVRAHEVGVVHRDLKPDNIMLVERGGDPDFVKILDFGIARVRMDDETPELTKTGAVFGTPSYMSPEQAAGDPVDHRTDLYAIGSLLFEMLTGRRVFQADRGAEVMAKHVSQEPPTPSEHAPGDEVEGELENLILELLEKNPDKRPETAVELQRRLLALDASARGGAFPGVAPEVSVAPELSPSEIDELDEANSERSRDADDAERSGAALRWIALFLLVAGAAAAGFYGSDLVDGAMTVASAESGAEPRSLAGARRTFLQREPVRAALRDFDRGAIQTGLDRLRGLEGGPYRDNPHLEFLMGRGYAEQERWRPALEHFERVLELEPRYVADRDFLGSLVQAFETTKKSVAKRVRALLEPELDRRIVRSQVARAAWRNSSPRARRRARELLETTGTLKELPKWMRHSIALRRARGCEEHRRRIEKLVELGDSRGLEILRIYDGYSDSVVGCVREDISEAIRRLEELDDGDG